MLGEWIPLVQSRRLPAVSGIYVIRHRESGKEYVGLSNNVKARLARHRRFRKNPSYFHLALRKHGHENFEVMLYQVGEVSTLNALEVAVIAARGTLVPRGYNLTAGGEGTSGITRSPETRAKLRAAQLGRVYPAEVRARVGQASLGRKKSAETRKKIGDAHRGKVVPEAAKARFAATIASRVWTDELRARASSPKFGLKPSAETRQKISQNSAMQRPVLVWPPESFTALEFPSASAAARFTGEGVSQVSRYCLGTVKVRKACRYRFCYL